MSERASALMVAYACVPGTGGTGARIARRSLALAASYSTDILSARCPGRPHIEKLEGRARLLRVSATGETLVARLAAFQRAVRRQLGGGEYDVVVFSDPFSGVEILEARDAYGYKAVYDAATPMWLELAARMNSGSEPRDELLLEAVRDREARCLAEADAVILPCEAARARLAKVDVTPRLVRIVPSAVDLRRFVKRAEEPPPRVGPFRAIYVGSAAPWQGLDVLAPALARAEKLGADVRIILAGVIGAELRSLLDAAATHGIESRIDVRGPVLADELPGLLASADVGLAPLSATPRNEVGGTSPQKVVEYLAAGLPVVMSDLPSAREILDNGDAGLLVAPDDPESLARTLVRLSTDATLYRRLALRARRLAELRYDAPREAGDLAALFAQLTSSGIAFDPGAFSPDRTTGSHETPTVREDGADAATDPQFTPPWSATRR